MRKSWTKIALLAALALIAVAPAVGVRAATGQGPGDNANNIAAAAIGDGFESNDTTEATAASTAQFEVLPGKLTLDQVPNLNFGQPTTRAVIDGPAAVGLESATALAVNPAPTAFDGNDADLIQVSDYRGSNVGWNLSAAAAAQFTHIGDPALKLNVTSMTLGGDEDGDNVPGNFTNTGNLVGGSAIWIAAADKGTGSNTVTLDDGELIIAKNVAARSGTYQATITWTLAATPTP